MVAGIYTGHMGGRGKRGSRSEPKPKRLSTGTDDDGAVKTTWADLHYFYCVECGLSLKEFRRLSFYEMNLIAERNRFQHYRNLEYVRNIMYASGSWKPGTTLEMIMSLPQDKKRKVLPGPSKADQERIKAKYAARNSKWSS